MANNAQCSIGSRKFHPLRSLFYCGSYTIAPTEVDEKKKKRKETLLMYIMNAHDRISILYEVTWSDYQEVTCLCVIVSVLTSSRRGAGEKEADERRG